MKFSEVYNEAILFWPSEIRIDDGKIVEGGGVFPSLGHYWNIAEVKSKNSSDWHKIMTWCIYNGLHKLALIEQKKEKSIISIEDVNLEYIEKRFCENLYDEDAGYSEQMKRNYENDLKKS